jgi:DNA transposition AAA+ family ATPase
MSGKFDEALTAAGLVNVDAIREQFLIVKAEEERAGYSLPKIAEKAGISYATLHAFSQNKYKGDNLNIARQVQRWLTTRDARELNHATVRKAPTFMRTKTSERIFDALEFAQSAPDFVVISGGPGVGKTTSIEAYQALGANIWVLTMEPSIKTISSLLNALGGEMGMLPRHSDNMSVTIRQKIRNTEGLVVVDEAQHMTLEQQDQLRQTVFDRGGIGLAFVGSDKLNETFARERAAGRSAQLVSRIGQRVNREKPLKSDVDLILSGWGIENEEVRAKALGIAMKPGALRQMNKALRIAFAVSDRRGDSEPSPDDLDLAWKQLGGS